MNVKELKSAALKDAYRLKSYQGKVKQQCKRLEFVDGLILKVSDYVDHSGQYSRPLTSAKSLAWRQPIQTIHLSEISD